MTTRPSWLYPTTWPPENEVYCGECRRMVQADVRLSPDGTPVPGRHYRVGLRSREDEIVPCSSETIVPGMALGWEDPHAAMHTRIVPWDELPPECRVYVHHIVTGGRR